MEPTVAIARLGFRRWYERQLFAGFAWLATCLMSGVLFAAVLEFADLRTEGFAPFVALIALYFAGLVVVGTFARFWSRLSRAQAYAREAVCPQCGAYGLFDVVDAAGHALVQCRGCSHRWRLHPRPGSGG